MLKVVGCLFEAHDEKLVALAAFTCALSALTAVQLLRHVQRSAGRAGVGWLCVAAVAGGSGIWATHFIAMLAFAPGLPSGYDVPRTAISLVFAMVLSGLGFGFAAYGKERLATWIGGAVVGGGIAAMHYTGMSAFEVAGRLDWDMALVVASLAIGVILGGFALSVALGGSGKARQVGGAVLLLLAICGHHFTAMGAVTIMPDPTVAIPDSAVPTSWLAMAVALASTMILLLAGSALAVDVRDRRQAAVEGERLRSLANAAVEGLVVCQGDIIVSANESFARLVGVDTTSLTGRSLSGFLRNEGVRLALANAPEQPAETELHRAVGSPIPVELIMRPIEYASQPHYAIAVRDLSARQRAERQIHYLAHHDPLTGLANRTSFSRRLDQEMRAAGQESDRKLAVLCLDLDRFKEVNDLFGHAAGDTMLERVARTVMGVLDDSQTMARLGGDEFAILMPCTHAAAAGELAECVMEALRTDTDEDGPSVASSIGIAIFPDDATDRQSLLGHADTALYRAKNEGRGTYRFFEAKMGTEVRERRVLEHDLRHAISRGEMELVYQPQTDVASGGVIGFEALLRWNSPQRGYVSPAVFIPIAEESGAILQVGEWVLRESCREAASWDKPLAIAVNVSAVQLHAPNFIELVHETLRHTGLAPDRLEIEITETALIRDPNRAQLTLRQLKALGLRIAMDDFGTGYSSLSNLRSYPFDKIKIDGSFIKTVHTNKQAAAIVRSVLGLGRGLGLPVLAEGVETADELAFLRSENCNEAQGYFMGRPGPIARFKEHTHHHGLGATAGTARAA